MHNSFVARYETAIAAYYDLMDNFCKTKGYIFEDGQLKGITYKV